MEDQPGKTVNVAILDMYDGEENEGMRGIREILRRFSDENGIIFTVDEFNVRQEGRVPGQDHDIYISSGGPGSPLDSEGSRWEKDYFEWFDALLAFNSDPGDAARKQVFLICHSLQLVCRHYGLAKVIPRKSPALGIFPVHPMPNVKNEPVFRGLPDPFYAVDSRYYQIVEPVLEKLAAMGSRILAIEKERPHVPLERAVMAIRINENIIGTQFHPEADAPGMTRYLNRPDKKETVIREHGEEKWKSMLQDLQDPGKILFTYGHILPNFLRQSIQKMGIQQSFNP